MNATLARIIPKVLTLEDLRTLEANVKARGGLDADVIVALDRRSAELARQLISDRTGLPLVDLTPAETKIVEAVATYAGVMKRRGTDPTRTLGQLKNLGLIEAAQASVMRTRPAAGFKVLTDEGHADLSYEQIIVDHPEEFTARAVWYARRTLGLPIALSKAPAAGQTVTQEKSAELLAWLRARRTATGHIPTFTNADGAAALGWNLRAHGRPYGNIQSRLDFGCYQAGFPPLGLAAAEPFDRAWDSAGRSWSFPIDQMQRAARSRQWRDAELDAVATATSALPGQAYLIWQEEIARAEGAVRAWAEGLEVVNDTPSGSPAAASESSAFPPPLAAEVAIVAGLEAEYCDATPEVRSKVSRTIERGPVGAAVKRANGFRCQVCAALGLPDLGFRKRNGQPYVEAHHVMPVSRGEVGSLAASNIMTVCANHHRQLHYGEVTVEIGPTTFACVIDGAAVSIPRPGVSAAPP